MKKKHLNILLLVFVIVIYAAIFFKLFGKKQVHSDNTINDFSYLRTVSNYNIKQDTFDISNLLQDPFRIHNKIKKSRTSTPKVKVSKTVTTPNSTPIVWPNITYYGFVKNNSKVTKLALLKIGTTLYRKREAESINGLHLVSVFNDSIVLKMQNEMKTVYRQ